MAEGWLRLVGHGVCYGCPGARVRGRAFYGVHPGDELARARPSLAWVRWLQARPSVFWDLHECEYAAVRAERSLRSRTQHQPKPLLDSGKSVRSRACQPLTCGMTP
jgi:hypothetical protein